MLYCCTAAVQQELEDELEDAKYLFHGVQLTEKETEELRYKEEILRLAKEKQKLMNQVGLMHACACRTLRRARFGPRRGRAYRGSRV